MACRLLAANVRASHSATTRESTGADAHIRSEQEAHMARLREASSLVPSELVDAIRPRHEEIAIRAYALYQQRGGSDGNDIEDWFQAERQLLHERRQQLAAV